MIEDPTDLRTYTSRPLFASRIWMRSWPSRWRRFLVRLADLDGVVAELVEGVLAAYPRRRRPWLFGLCAAADGVDARWVAAIYRSGQAPVAAPSEGHEFP